MVGIYQEAFSEPPWNEEWSREDVLADIENAKGQAYGQVLVAEIDGEIVGLGWGYQLPEGKFSQLNGFPKETGYIDDIAVDKSYRRMGAGRALTEELMGRFFQQGLRQTVLRTSETNLAAIGLYEGLGFEKVGKDDAYEGAILMGVDYGTD